MFQLRQYQKDILNSLYRKLKDSNKIILSLPTGAGKTVMMAAWAKKMAQSGKRTVIVVDREELVGQTYKLLPQASVLKSGWHNCFNSNALIHIVMLQTAYKRMNALLDINADYVFFDEIHNYYEGQMFAALCDCQPNAHIIGVSATPIDNKGYLLEGFDDYICEIQTEDLIKMGYLVRPQHYTPTDYNLDLSFIRITNGDYDVNQLDDLMANTDCATKICSQWSQIALGRKTIVFCTSIKQAKILCNHFNEQAIPSDVIFSGRLDRSNVMEKFLKGETRVMFNVGILVAGFDDPSVECIIFANPTKILRRYLQQCGRGLRIAEGKKDCLMLDFADIVRQHGFCNDIRIFKHRLKPSDQCTIKQCPECGAIVSKTVKQCPYCSYDFTPIDEEKSCGAKKKDIEKLEKAFDMQQELKQEISQLVDARGYKNGYKWFLFLDCLKTKRPTESSIQFFKRKLSKINKIKKQGWKLASLKYD